MLWVFAGEYSPAGQSSTQRSLKVPDKPARNRILAEANNREEDHIQRPGLRAGSLSILEKVSVFD